MTLSVISSAQIDSTTNRIDSFLLNQKGLLGKLAKNIVANKPIPLNAPIRNDLLFIKFKGKMQIQRKNL